MTQSAVSKRLQRIEAEWDIKVVKRTSKDVYKRQMMGRLPMLIIAIVYFSFFALRFSPDEPILPTSLQTKKQKIMHR